MKGRILKLGSALLLFGCLYVGHAVGDVPTTTPASPADNSPKNVVPSPPTGVPSNAATTPGGAPAPVNNNPPVPAAGNPPSAASNNAGGSPPATNNNNNGRPNNGYNTYFSGGFQQGMNGQQVIRDYYVNDNHVHMECSGPDADAKCGNPLPSGGPMPADLFNFNNFVNPFNPFNFMG